MNPPRRRRSTLPVIIVSAATMRPALLSMNVPTTPTATASGTRGRLVTTSIKPIEIVATIAVDRQLAVAVGQPADQGSTDQRQNAPGDETPRAGPVFSSTPTFATSVQTDIRNHRKARPA